jgi:hypothetical protein
MKVIILVLSIVALVLVIVNYSLGNTDYYATPVSGNYYTKDGKSVIEVRITKSGPQYQLNGMLVLKQADISAISADGATITYNSTVFFKQPTVADVSKLIPMRSQWRDDGRKFYLQFQQSTQTFSRSIVKVMVAGPLKYSGTYFLIGMFGTQLVLKNFDKNQLIRLDTVVNTSTPTPFPTVIESSIPSLPSSNELESGKNGVSLTSQDTVIVSGGGASVESTDSGLASINMNPVVGKPIEGYVMVQKTPRVMQLTTDEERLIIQMI